MGSLLLNAIKGGYIMVETNKIYEFVERYTPLDDDNVLHFAYINEVIRYSEEEGEYDTRIRNLYSRSRRLPLSYLTPLKQSAVLDGGIKHQIDLDHEMMEDLKPIFEKDIDALLRLYDYLLNLD